MRYWTVFSQLVHQPTAWEHMQTVATCNAKTSDSWLLVVENRQHYKSSSVQVHYSLKKPNDVTNQLSDPSFFIWPSGLNVTLFLGPKGAAVSYSLNITKGKQKAGNEQHVSIDNYFLFVHAGYYGEPSRAGISEPSAWPHAWTRVTWSWLFGLKSVVTSSCKQLWSCADDHLHLAWRHLVLGVLIIDRTKKGIYSLRPSSIPVASGWWGWDEKPRY